MLDGLKSVAFLCCAFCAAPALCQAESQPAEAPRAEFTSAASDGLSAASGAAAFGQWSAEQSRTLLNYPARGSFDDVVNFERDFRRVDRASRGFGSASTALGVAGGAMSAYSTIDTCSYDKPVACYTSLSKTTGSIVGMGRPAWSVVGNGLITLGTAVDAGRRCVQGDGGGCGLGIADTLFSSSSFAGPAGAAISTSWSTGRFLGSWIDNGITDLNGGQSIGEWFYDFTHPEPAFAAPGQSKGGGTKDASPASGTVAKPSVDDLIQQALNKANARVGASSAAFSAHESDGQSLTAEARQAGMAARADASAALGGSFTGLGQSLSAANQAFSSPQPSGPSSTETASQTSGQAVTASPSPPPRPKAPPPVAPVQPSRPPCIPSGPYANAMCGIQ